MRIQSMPCEEVEGCMSEDCRPCHHIRHVTMALFHRQMVGGFHTARIAVLAFE